MSIHIADNEVAVDHDYFWLGMDSCPRGVKVQLLGLGGVAVYGQYDGKDNFWRGWAPLPKVKRIGSNKREAAPLGDGAAPQADTATGHDPAHA